MERKYTIESKKYSNQKLIIKVGENSARYWLIIPDRQIVYQSQIYNGKCIRLVMGQMMKDASATISDHLHVDRNMPSRFMRMWKMMEDNEQ